MPTARPAAAQAEHIVVNPVKWSTIRVALVGDSPLIPNRVSEKAKRELLMPKAKKNAAEKASTLKHDPLTEFRGSPYAMGRGEHPTHLAALSAWFKGAMETAALVLPGITKSGVEKLVWVEGERVPLYGLPEVFTRVVRMADVGRTPDVKTRCIVPRWAVEVAVSYITPMLNERSVLNLLVAAGQVAGVGDWRPGKGGNFGRFSVVNADDPRFLAVVEEGGAAAQRAAVAEPVCYDDETEELISWFAEEVALRGQGGMLATAAD